NILIKSSNYVAQRGIKVKPISLKILAPFLETSSLEEEEVLQEKWAIMLTNMIDSELNLQNHIFPFILGQISLQEFDALKKLQEDEAQLSKNQETIRALGYTYDLPTEMKKLKEEVNHQQQFGLWIPLNDFEIANLTRLGLVRDLPPSINI